jgi:hypothetical protein
MQIVHKQDLKMGLGIFVLVSAFVCGSCLNSPIRVDVINFSSHYIQIFAKNASQNLNFYVGIDLIIMKIS